MLLMKTFLKWMKLPSLLDSLNRLNLLIVGLNREESTGLDRLPVQKDRTGTTARRITTDVCAGQS
jgi:hypothetical protein